MDIQKVTDKIVNDVRDNLANGKYYKINYDYYGGTDDCVTVSLGFCKSATFGLNGGTFSFYVTRFWSTYSLDVSDNVKQEFIEYVKQAVANDRKDNKTEAHRKREAFFSHFL